MRRFLFTGLILCIFLASFVHAESVIKGDRFDSLQAAQHVELQRDLEQLFPESQGFHVTGPIDLLPQIRPGIRRLFSAVRVICPDAGAWELAHRILDSLGKTGGHSAVPNDTPLTVGYPWSHGSFWNLRFDHGIYHSVHFTSIQQTRFIIWERRIWLAGADDHDPDLIEKYSRHVSNYLRTVDSGNTTAEPPQAVDFDLPNKFDLYAPDPDYIIQGYQNYKDFLSSHSEIHTEFASGIVAFVPTKSTLERLKVNAPRQAYINKEAAKLQEEYREFFERGGDVRVMQTLTRAGFDTLTTGEYFFAVGCTGKIRFGRELSREEVNHIEEQTGRKAPRANHAFLFPGEPVLTAGAFFIDDRSPEKLVKVNAQSGHFFYSNISGTIREDISERSDHYLLSLGHFFRSLDGLGINYEHVLISKM